MKRIITLLIPFFLVAGCDVATDVGKEMDSKYNLHDSYPEIQKGISNITARALTDISTLPGEAPMMFALENGCRLVASADTYGNHSISITPKQISCVDGTIVKVTQDQLSKAYIDKRYFSFMDHSIEFQVYDTTIITLN